MIAFYGLMCVLGTVLPYSQLLPWVIDNGPNLMLAVSLIAGDQLSAMAWLDVVLSAVVLIVFILVEAKRQGIAHAWIAIVGTCTVGVSLGLPLFLLLAELNRQPVQTT